MEFVKQGQRNARIGVKAVAGPLPSQSTTMFDSTCRQEGSSRHNQRSSVAFFLSALIACCGQQIALAQESQYTVIDASFSGSNNGTISTAAVVSSSVELSQNSHVRLASASLPAMSTNIGAQDWGALIQSAKSQLKPESIPNPATARQALDQASEQLLTYLKNSGESNQANWLSFLKWNALQQELGKADPNPDVLVQLERNMRQNYVGLDNSPFLNYRKSLENYVRALRFGTDPSSSLEGLSKRLDQLAQNMNTQPSGSDLARQRDIEFVLSYLDQTGQNNGLIQQIRNRFGNPNFRVLASQAFIASSTSRGVAQPNPVAEIILGTKICGESCLLGELRPMLVDNPNCATLRLDLCADFSSQNVGTNRGVKLNTRGHANVAACESISLTENGLVSHGDTSVTAPLTSQILSIEHPLKIIRKFATKKAAQQKPLADSIARERLENRIRNQFHQQIADQLSETNSRLRPANLATLDRLGLVRPVRSSWSSLNHLSVLWNQQGQTQLSAPNSCPHPVSSDGVTIQLHQSAIINTIDPVLSGRILRNSDLDDFALQFGLEPSQALREEAGGEMWAITMAGFHPVEVEFDDQLIRFRIRTTKLDRGEGSPDQSLDQSASIDAAYRVSLVDGAIQLERQGDVNIEFVGKQQGGLRGVALRSFLKKKFDSVFKPQLFEKPLRPTDRLPPQFALRISEVSVDDGWLQAVLR
jgi:hypothetical protein